MQLHLNPGADADVMGKKLDLLSDQLRLGRYFGWSPDYF